MTDDFMPIKGAYKMLRCFQVADIIYRLTYIFCDRYLSRGDRTRDQMIQAARSGKQNIAEGSAAATTSTKTELHLTNVAKASLQELLLDYEDYLHTRGGKQWEMGDPRLEQTRAVLRSNNTAEFYVAKSENWSAETLCNVVITMLHQCDYLLRKLIERKKEDFVKNGGLTEAMTRARMAYRHQSDKPDKSDEKL